MGGRLEFEDQVQEKVATNGRGSQTIWLKFQAEKNVNDAAYQLIRLRKKLGLPIEVPLHAPGGLATLKQHLKNAENEKVLSFE